MVKTLVMQSPAPEMTFFFTLTISRHKCAMSGQTDGEIESICQKTVFHCISATKKIVFLNLLISAL